MKRNASFLAIGCRHFMAVAETGSVRAAARRLNLAPSAISRQLNLLESDLGSVLFDRDGRRLVLAPAGETLLLGLRRAQLAQEEVTEQLGALTGLRRGLIRIASVESLSVALLPELLQAFSRKYPGITFKVDVDASETVNDKVREQLVDIGFTFNPSNLDGLETALRHDLPLAAIMAPRHPLAKSKSLTLAQCLAHPVAWPSERLSMRAILDKALGTKRVSPAYECNSLRLMSSLARRGQCIAFQTAFGIERELKEKTLVMVPLTDRALVLDRMMVITRHGTKARPALEALLALVSEEFSNLVSVRKS